MVRNDYFHGRNILTTENAGGHREKTRGFIVLCLHFVVKPSLSLKLFATPLRSGFDPRFDPDRDLPYTWMRRLGRFGLVGICPGGDGVLIEHSNAMETR